MYNTSLSLGEGWGEAKTRIYNSTALSLGEGRGEAKNKIACRLH